MVAPAMVEPRLGAAESKPARDAPSGGGALLPQLDALRGVAIAAVFVQHWRDGCGPLVEDGLARLGPSLGPWIGTVVHHAHWGVDLFFVLSGFSLALAWARADRAGRPLPAPGRFLLRRALRLYPAFLVAVALVVATHPSVVRRDGFGASMLAHAALLQGYVTPGGIVLVGAAWSLTTEAHFYLALVPLARPLVTGRLGKRIAVAAALCVGSWLVRAALHHAFLEPGVPSALLEASQRRWMPSRLDQFVAGAFVAGLYADRERSTPARAGAAALVVGSVTLLVVAFRLEGALYLSPGGSWPYALVTLATAGLVAGATAAGPEPSRWLAPKALQRIGVASYGVFLLHQLVLGAVAAVVALGADGWLAALATAALAFAISVALGWASWTWIERPALRLASRR